MSIQPFRGDQVLVIEARDPEGRLKLRVPQPPSGYVTLDEVYQMFWRDPKNDQLDGTWENLSAWLDSKNWKLRAKTW